MAQDERKISTNLTVLLGYIKWKITELKENDSFGNLNILAQIELSINTQVISK